MEEERRRRLSLVKDEEAKEAHEKELRRQHRLIAVLEAEEARARAFYEYEFANNFVASASDDDINIFLYLFFGMHGSMS